MCRGSPRAELVELLIPGDDEEETEAFRQRVLDSFQSQAFGGNQADYREKVLAMDGVGAVKVHAVWNADVSPSALVPGEAVDTWYTGVIISLEEPVAAWLTAGLYGGQEQEAHRGWNRQAGNPGLGLRGPISHAD